ncbi:MAG: histidine triad nucleotide-binding protein, partial [Betaproteobacteria bacterium]|nr:histidine triad nucleotide-binding protein [Betaproteobacteria bacterium]
MTTSANCIFCKIAQGQIPSKKIYEDDDFIAFHDINPRAPIHLLVIPKLHIESLQHVDASHQELLGKMLVLVPKLAAENGASEGFKTLINTGPAGGQEVYHL